MNRVWKLLVPLLLSLVWLPWLWQCAHFWWVQDARTFSPPDVTEQTLHDAAARLSVQEIVLQTPDGEELLAWYRPGEPVVLYFHGRPGSLMRTAPLFTETKAGVLAVSYRGYPGSTGKPSERGLHIDARTAFDWLAERVPPEHIILHGKSLGGLVATRLASEVEAGGLVLETTYTSLLPIAQMRYPWVPVELLYRSPFDNRPLLPGIDEETIVFAAGRDGLVPGAHPRMLSKLIPAARLVVAPSAVHATRIPFETSAGRRAYPAFLLRVAER